MTTLKDNIDINKDFETALSFINETNRHVFLTGKACTGKTTFLKYLRENAFGLNGKVITHFSVSGGEISTAAATSPPTVCRICHRLKIFRQCLPLVEKQIFRQTPSCC